MRIKADTQFAAVAAPSPAVGASRWRAWISAALGSLVIWAVVFGPAPAAHADAGWSLSINTYKQNQSNWCWATSAEVVIQHMTHTNYSQCNLVKAEMGTTACANVQATDAQVRNLLLKHLSSASISNGALSYVALTSNINRDSPIPAHIQWKGGGGHMVTIDSYENAYNNGQASSTIIDYSNSNGAVGMGTGAAEGSKTLSSFWNNSSFSQYSSLIGIRR